MQANKSHRVQGGHTCDIIKCPVGLAIHISIVNVSDLLLCTEIMHFSVTRLDLGTIVSHA